MYKFEEILLGNKSELLKQASIPASQPKLLPPRSTTGAIDGAGNATGTNPSMQPNKLGSGGNPLFGKSEAQRRVEQYTGTGTEYGPVARFSPFFRGPHYIGKDLTYFTRRGMPMTQTQFNTYAAVFGGDPREMNPSDAIDSALNYANRHDVDYMGFNTGQQLNLAMGENRGQHARKTWTNNFNNGDEQVRRGMLILGFRPQGYDSEDYAGWQADMRANYGQQPQWNVDQYRANINAGNNVELQNARLSGQYAQGWSNWNANADNIMRQQAQERERWRQAQLQADRKFATNFMKEYAPDFKGTADDWNALPADQRKKYFDDTMKTRRMERYDALEKDPYAAKQDYEQYAANMERVHGKAWDARGFTPEQREAYIQKEYAHQADRRRKELTEYKGTLATGQTAPAQPVASQKSNPNIEPLPQIEQDITPEENTVVENKQTPIDPKTYVDPLRDDTEVDTDVAELAGSFGSDQEYDENGMPLHFAKVSSANIMSILFPQRARDIVKEYF